MTRVQKEKLNKRIISLLMALAVFVSTVCVEPVNVYAADKTLTLSAARKLIEKNSDKLEGLEGQILTKQSAYKSAVKSVSLKEKNLRTFRWSPLLSFHFPEQPDFAEAVEFKMKPMQASVAIDVAKHAYADRFFEEYKIVYQHFVTIVSLQEKIDFNNQRLALMETTLAKNKARWLMGEASESDIKNMENTVESLNKTIAADSRTLLNAKKKLSTALDLDVSTGYTFENPFVQADIPRSALPKLIQSTLDNDQTFYVTCSNATVAYQTLKTDETLIKRWYKGSDYNIIRSYVNQALNGEKFSKKGFKSAYESFLTAIDRYWQGKKKIFLFIKIPREWMRGSLDGVRYIEDDPYALYDAALEYQDALNDKKSMENDLTSQVEDSFNNVASMKNSYMTYVEQVKDASEQMKKDAILNRVGKLSYEEFASSQSSYDQLQQDMLQSLADYSSVLYDFDRLTCGAASKYMKRTNSSMTATGGGQSNPVDEDDSLFEIGSDVGALSAEEQNGASYYISLLVAQNIFEVSVNIPDELGVKVTDFALLVDGEQIGDKTPVSDKLRHLGLIMEDVAEAKIRLFNGADVICDCNIDPSAYNGPLNIITDYKVSTEDKTDLGVYSVDTLAGISKLKMDLNAGAKEKYFKLRTTENKYLGGEDFNLATETFVYVGVLGSGMDTLTIEFFDENKNFLYEGYFDTGKSKIKKLK